MKRKLQRKSGPRKALLKNLATSLILYEKLKTTTPRAKEVRPYLDKLISVAKKDDLSARRCLLKNLPKNAVVKLMDDIAPSFSERKSGFVKMIKIAARKGDNAPLCLLTFSEREQKIIKEKPKKEEKKEKVKHDQKSKK